MQERVIGAYRDDEETFRNELKELFGSEDFVSKNAREQHNPLLDLDLSKVENKSTVDLIFQDRDRFRMEQHDQMRRKVIKYESQTKRSSGDFIMPKANEQDSLRKQQYVNDANIEYLEEKEREKESNQDKDDFDKEAYYKLKEELSQRKHAKEQLLSQGLPQFKAYMRF